MLSILVKLAIYVHIICKIIVGNFYSFCSLFGINLVKLAFNEKYIPMWPKNHSIKDNL